MCSSQFKQKFEKTPDRWSANSEAGKLLRSGMESGEIDPNAPPKQIWESHPLFQQYTLDKFRAALNKSKAEKNSLLKNNTAGMNNTDSAASLFNNETGG